MAEPEHLFQVHLEQVGPEAGDDTVLLFKGYAGCSVEGCGDLISFTEAAELNAVAHQWHERHRGA